MGKLIKEVEQFGHDDPSNKTFSEQEVSRMFIEAYALLISGMNQIEEAANSILVGDSSKKEIISSALKLMADLQQLHSATRKYIKDDNTEPIDKLTRTFRQGQGSYKNGINLNESVDDKVKATIKRIIEVNKKLNYGT